MADLWLTVGCVACPCSVRLEKARELAEQKVRNSQQVVDRVEQVSHVSDD